jgi:hypothetical protein
MTEQLIQMPPTVYAIVLQLPGAVNAQGLPLQEYLPGYETKEAALGVVREAIKTGVFEAETPVGTLLVAIGPGVKFIVLTSHEVERQHTMARLTQPVQGFRQQ